jgi:hypothetical protein
MLDHTSLLALAKSPSTDPPREIAILRAALEAAADAWPPDPDLVLRITDRLLKALALHHRIAAPQTIDPLGPGWAILQEYARLLPDTTLGQFVHLGDDYHGPPPV